MNKLNFLYIVIYMQQYPNVTNLGKFKFIMIKVHFFNIIFMGMR